MEENDKMKAYIPRQLHCVPAQKQSQDPYVHSDHRVEKNEGDEEQREEVTLSEG